MREKEKKVSCCCPSCTAHFPIQNNINNNKIINEKEKERRNKKKK